MGMRWAVLQVTLLSRVRLVSPLTVRRGGECLLVLGWRWASDKNHSRADTLHQSHVKQSHHQGADWVWSAQVSTLHHLHLQHEEYLAIVVWAHLLLRLSKYNSRMTSNTKLRMSNIKYKISQHVVIHETNETYSIVQGPLLLFLYFGLLLPATAHYPDSLIVSLNTNSNNNLISQLDNKNV